MALPLKWYKAAANAGDTDAYYRIGLMYEAGEGVKKNKDAALALYRKTAEDPDADQQEEAQAAVDRLEDELASRAPVT
ncbi:SEL1-like repeat protein [Streptococcus thermophilus]|uniref:SEL1-like repeat protein n=1 Tax=Streptococcus thermophilus TaxID=1308 RepID=UPI00300E5123